MAIIITTAMVSGGAAMAILYYSHIHESQRLDPDFVLKYIDQKGDLPSHYIEEILGLCADYKVNIHQFNPADAKEKLLDNPLIQSAEVKNFLPASCKIIYTLFEPVALLSDWDNAAIDCNGRLIPFQPFYHGVGIPTVTVGELKNPKWGKKLKLARIHLALKILKTLPLQELIRLDVSRVDLPSFGQREIIITLQDAIIRLNPDKWEDGWNNFLKMRHVFNHVHERVIDFRISGISLIDQKV